MANIIIFFDKPTIILYFLPRNVIMIISRSIIFAIPYVGVYRFLSLTK